MTPYSLVEHLAKAIWFSNWREGFPVAFTAYFDASGDETCEQTLVVSVAGFIAPSGVWAEFEQKWRERLANEGISKFHMVECANYTEDFDGWRKRERDRQRLLHDLVSLIIPLSRKFACAIPLRMYRKTLSADLRDDPIYKAYALAGRWCAGRVRQWTWTEKVPTIDRVGFYYEDGDTWQGELKKQMVDDDLPAPIFKPKFDKYSKDGKTLVEHGLIPFQAADVLAYLTFLKYKCEIKKTNWGEKENIRWMLDAIHSGVLGPLDYVTKRNVQGLNILARASSHVLLKRADE